MSWDADTVAAVMRQVGLDPDRFDTEATAVDLDGRCDLNRSLLELLADRDPVLPATTFDPRWHR